MSTAEVLLDVEVNPVITTRFNVIQYILSHRSIISLIRTSTPSISSLWEILLIFCFLLKDKFIATSHWDIVTTKEITLNKDNSNSLAVANCVICFNWGNTEWFRELHSKWGKYKVNRGEVEYAIIWKINECHCQIRLRMKIGWIATNGMIIVHSVTCSKS